MSILLGGIIGNVTDRILYGHVIDFILFNFGKFLSPVFNVADALQWLGYGMIVYAVIQEGEILWPENNTRKRYWINPSFQLKYCFLLVGVGCGISLITSVFSFTYLRVTMIDLIGENKSVLDRFLIPFIETLGLMTVGISLALFSVGKIISHRIAGPVYAFEKYLATLIESQHRPIHKFRLRSNDEFKHLEELAEKIRNVVQTHNTSQDFNLKKEESPETDPS
jgi:signal peptidase II